MNGARDAYERMRIYGSSLPTWDAGLRARLRREARLRKQQRNAAEAAVEAEAPGHGEP